MTSLFVVCVPRPVRNFLIMLPAIALTACVAFAGDARTADTGPEIWAPDQHVTQFGPHGSALLPTQQLLTPAGRKLELPKMRPQVLALSPDGKLLATSGMTSDLVLIDPETGKITQHVPIPPDQAATTRSAGSSHNLFPQKQPEVSYIGLTFSPNGRRIYLSNVCGSIAVFAVDPEHHVKARKSITLPPTGLKYHPRPIPAGLAVSADGSRVYVAMNVANQLFELDAESGKVLRTFDVGNAPFDVVLANYKAYVSNWGGRRVDDSGPTGPIGVGARVRVDPVRFIASEGSVSVVDLEGGKVSNEIMVGLHASGLAATPDGRYVAVANASSDTVSIIDTSSDAVVETISTRWDAHDLFGASPNALAFDRFGKTLYVCNGTQNSVAVIAFNPGRSKLQGLIPTGWYPGAVGLSPNRHEMYVANIKGVGSGKRYERGDKIKYNSHQYYGTLSLMPLPEGDELAGMTKTVLANTQRRASLAAMLPPRPGAPPRPVPERVGEPSVFKHVIYVIKENRTYDQVLGDMPQGQGEADLCIFGEHVTPNQHKLCREFVLLDNTYCNGINSAEGHQWTGSAFATDYLERSYEGFPRSYPDGMEDGDIDALAYAPTGFIWDNALAHGKSLRDYGEFTISTSGWADKSHKRSPSFVDYFHYYLNADEQIHIGSRPGIESLRNYLDAGYVGWDLDIPDAIRADRFISELHQFESSGDMPDLCIICLPDDHTSGTRPHAPTPAAQVADNDLALGRIVEAVSHSGFWKNTCILAIEDDPQAGWDHVSAYRTTAYVASAYTKRGVTVHTNYNQPSLLHTIELILGLPPMNQFDALATPMSDCFTSTADLTPYSAVPSQIPLNELNPEPEAIANPIERHYAEVSRTLPVELPDRCPEDLLNHILWTAQKGSAVPFPSRLSGDD